MSRISSRISPAAAGRGGPAHDRGPEPAQSGIRGV